MQIVAEELNFRFWYDVLPDLLEAEKKDEFPPRFKVKLNCYNPSNSNTLDLKYNIGIKKNGDMDRFLSLNVFILGTNKAMQKGYNKIYKCIEL